MVNKLKDWWFSVHTNMYDFYFLLSPGKYIFFKDPEYFATEETL